MGILSFAGPLLVLPFSHSLVPVVAVLAAGRYLAMIAYVICCRWLLPIMRTRLSWHSALVVPLLTFGGWMTVSGLKSRRLCREWIASSLVRWSRCRRLPIMRRPRRSCDQVARYSRCLGRRIVPSVLSRFSLRFDSKPTLVPQVAGSHCSGDGPFLASRDCLRHFGLKQWLGETFADNGTVPLQILALGTFANSMAQPPVALVQGAGRANWTGKMHLAELPFYLILLFGC